MLTDAAALFFALLAVKFARRPPNARHTFGWLRLTTLAAFVNAIALVVITIFIVWEAFQRFRHPQPIAGMTMMVIAVAGLLANILAFWILHRGSGEKNLNVRAAALHEPAPIQRWKNPSRQHTDPAPLPLRHPVHPPLNRAAPRQ
jgi:cation diffusion facilitator family transporter